MDNEQLLQSISDMMDKKFDEKLQPINNKFDNMDNRLDNMDNRLEKLESEMSAMRVGQMELKKEIREVKHKVNDTYELALEAWGTSTENRVWLQNIESTT
ncbi:MAG: hypothetical protein K2O32_13930 [Acetatifactor sp.]|nr:hypothetical protein [Acetatifactor sp.]